MASVTRELDHPQDKGMRKPGTEDLIIKSEPEFPSRSALCTAWIAGKCAFPQGLVEVLAEVTSWLVAARKLEEG